MGSSVPDGRPDIEAGGDQDAGLDRVTAAAAELYGAEPREFTSRRKALAAAARAAGDAAAARQISALRKPTRAAWIVNRLARTDPGAPGRLASLAAGLRAAERAKDGPRLRKLSEARGPLIDALAGQALTAAGIADPPAGLRGEVSATLTAAMADPDVAAGFAAGTLTHAVQWAGFGLAPFGSAPDAATTGAPAEPVPDDYSRPDGPPARQAPERSRRSAPRGTPAPAARPPPSAEEAVRQAARRREIFADAERAVAAATAAAADATAAEDRLEAEVRDLEERLTRARADLAAARLRARRAEAAERRTRQDLGRLPRP